MLLVTILTLVFLFIESGYSQVARIVGGQNANIKNYPYQISMRWTYGSPQPMHFCGGSIVTKKHIVTAAHCVVGKTTPQMMQYIKIYTGTSRTDSGGKSHDVKRITVHPQYTGEPHYYNDIAVITLQQPITFNEYQKPIKLPKIDVRQGVTAVLTGWGNTNPHYQQDPVNLQKASMTLISSSQCQQQMYGVGVQLTSSQLCSQKSAGVGACQGDSGGPLAVNNVLVGLASFVMGKCAEGYPDVFTNVYSFVNFIKQVAQSER